MPAPRSRRCPRCCRRSVRRRSSRRAASATPALPTRALSLRPMRFVGRISYAWYVWHWPALVFAAAAWGPLSTPAALAVTAASLVPTLVTHRWIEEPIRRSRLAVPRDHARDGTRGRGARARGRDRRLVERPGADRRSPPARPKARRSSAGRRRSSGRRRRCGRRRAMPTTIAAARSGTDASSTPTRSARRPASMATALGVHDRRAVRRLARDAVVPGARAHRRSAPLAARRAHQGRLPARGGAASSTRRCGARTPSATCGAPPRWRGSSANGRRWSSPPAPSSTA